MNLEGDLLYDSMINGDISKEEALAPILASLA